MAIWNYRAELIPRGWIMREYGEIPAVLDPEKDESSAWVGLDCTNDFISRAEAILPATQKTDTFVCCGSQGSHRIELWIQDGLPDLLGIKLDLRQPNLALFERIVEYAKYLDTLIIPDDRYTVVVPSMENLLADLQLSRAYKFCGDPRGCLTEIAAQNNSQAAKHLEAEC